MSGTRGARGVARVAMNEGCEVQAAMVAEDANEAAFHQEYAGGPPPPEFGVRESAVRYGRWFEGQLTRDHAARLRHALARAEGLDPRSLTVRNIAEEVPSADGGEYRAERLERTRGILRDFAHGRGAPHLLVQPQLELTIVDDYVLLISPDFLRLDAIGRTLHPGEIKAVITADGLASEDDLERMRLQAAVEVVALRAEADRFGIAHLVPEVARFVGSSGLGAWPDAPHLERLGAEVRAVERGIAALARTRARLMELRDGREVALAELVPQLSFHWQQDCLSSCVLADLVCRRRIEGRATSLGDAAADLLGPDTELAHLAAVVAGGAPTGPREALVAAEIAEAIRALGHDPAELRRTT